MNYPQVPISAVASFINGFPFKPDDWGHVGYPIIRIQNLTDPKKISNRTNKKVPDKYLVTKGDILVSWSATIDIFEWDREDSLLNQHIFKVVFDFKRIDKEFFKLSIRKTIEELSKFAHGSTMKHIIKGDFDKHKIPFPPLDDQKRIAHLLGKVEGMIAQRKQHLQQLDDLLKSVFLDMFGDPVRNEKGWGEKKLSELCLKITDGTHDTPERIQEGIVFITGKHIRSFVVDYANSDFVSSEDHKIIYSRCDPQYGDVLYTNIGINLGTAAMNTVHYEFSMKNVALLRPDTRRLHSRFLEHFLNHDREKTTIISELSSGGAQQFLGLGRINMISVLTPPIDLQCQFAAIVEKVEGLKSRYQENLADLQNVYDALSQKAFKGELDLSRVNYSRGRD